MFTFLLLACSNDNTISSFQGQWNGTFKGDDMGTWNAQIMSQGVVTGTATSDVFNNPDEISGSVDGDGQFSATVGSTISGTIFTGQFSGDRVSGSWVNQGNNLEGSWEGERVD
ncbi:hypothetical protein WIW50_02860 [Flavobacteriaceae bacterium 3-367]